MKKLAAGAVLAALVVAVAAAPAAAQRDPFAPRAPEQATVTTTAGGGQQDPFRPRVREDAPAAQPQPEPQPQRVGEAAPRRDPAPADPLPATGGDADGFLVLAYVLVAVGAAFTALARTRRLDPGVRVRR